MSYDHVSAENKLMKNVFLASQLFLYMFFIPAFSSVADTLDAYQTLSGDHTLVSRDGTFEMGFFRPGKSPKYNIGIWTKLYRIKPLFG